MSGARYRAGREITLLSAEHGYRRVGYMCGPVGESTELKRPECPGFPVAESLRFLGRPDKPCGGRTTRSQAQSAAGREIA
ncbi:hypothetical protein GCM10011348_30950 [Marinobacterium nitratireducens]|uniref:Uncharacterized protein n=1 Tax=Marinobacterium nitratireducens TaxID=518897 RepID=A0A917ZKM5_9GAMM|nr:hypothetical protein GCM10011348_30950 [Marinobacterium nitratireducens]